MKKSLFILVNIFIFNFSFSQNTEQPVAIPAITDTININKLTIQADSAIMALVSGKEDKNCGRYSTVIKVQADAKKEIKTELITGSSDDPCVIYPKKMGVKIQIFYSKDRLAAEAEKNNFIHQFPTMSEELVYARPDYKVLVGEYLARGSAGADLARIKKKYPASFLVAWRVWCRLAK